jgi:hypothetical protein
MACKTGVASLGYERDAFRISEIIVKTVPGEAKLENVAQKKDAHSSGSWRGSTGRLITWKWYEIAASERSL